MTVQITTLPNIRGAGALFVSFATESSPVCELVCCNYGDGSYMSFEGCHVIGGFVSNNYRQ